VTEVVDSSAANATSVWEKYWLLLSVYPWAADRLQVEPIYQVPLIYGLDWAIATTDAAGLAEAHD
jgi:hypothetical protein